MTLFAGKGDGTFKTPINIPTRVEPFTTKAVDLNGDGKMDLLVTSAHQFSVGVYLGNGDGTFQPATYYDSGAEPHFVDTADFNGDGKADLIIADFEEAAVSVLLGNGDGTFQPKKTYFCGDRAERNAAGSGAGGLQRRWRGRRSDCGFSMRRQSWCGTGTRWRRTRTCRCRTCLG